MEKDPKDIVREGYDKIAEQYDDFRDRFSHKAELDEFMNLVRPRGHVLDVGCGSGVRVARALVDRGFQVTGIDISQKMIDIAKHCLPEAVFEVGDMTALEYEDETFDGIVSTYAVFHVPRTKHYALFLDFRRILKKGGALLVSVGSMKSDGVWDWEEVQSVPMYWSNHDPKKSVELLSAADFEIVFAKHVESGGETHFWILARAK
ncbi:MAG: class I SAM-dependent methyltransferase [Candidatus Thorarchaeota archaeon]